MVQRALAVAHGERVESYSAYNVLSNNCEHFASWARCGWSVSCQVAKRGEQLVKLAMVAGAAVLPRPLSVLGNKIINIVIQIENILPLYLMDQHNPRFNSGGYLIENFPQIVKSTYRRALCCWPPHGGRDEADCRPGSQPGLQ